MKLIKVEDAVGQVLCHDIISTVVLLAVNLLEQRQKAVRKK